MTDTATRLDEIEHAIRANLTVAAAGVSTIDDLATELVGRVAGLLLDELLPLRFAYLAARAPRQLVDAEGNPRELAATFELEHRRYGVGVSRPGLTTHTSYDLTIIDLDYVAAQYDAHVEPPMSSGAELPPGITDGYELVRRGEPFLGYASTRELLTELAARLRPASSGDLTVDELPGIALVDAERLRAAVELAGRLLPAELLDYRTVDQ